MISFSNIKKKSILLNIRFYFNMFSSTQSNVTLNYPLSIAFVSTKTSILIQSDTGTSNNYVHVYMVGPTINHAVVRRENNLSPRANVYSPQALKICAPHRLECIHVWILQWIASVATHDQPTSRITKQEGALEKICTNPPIWAVSDN